MIKRTFTIFNADDSIYGYLFDVTHLEAQEIVNKINEEEGKGHYLIDGLYNR